MKVNYTRPWLPEYQRKIIDSEARYTVTEATTKAGKEQPLDAILKTPSGNKLMGEIAVGDFVLTPNGKSKVNEIFPQGKKDIYRITFSDRSFTECGLDHIWKINYSRKYKGRGKYKDKPELITQKTRKDKIGFPRLLTLREILNFSEQRWRHFSIPLTSPVEYSKKTVLVQPYLMGVILGDGCLRNGSVGVSSEDQEILDFILPMIPAEHSLKYTGGHDYKICVKDNAAQLAWDKKTMASQFRHYGLMETYSDTKFIPDDYMYNSTEVRKELLRGLFDTDGYVNKHGQICIELTSKKIIDGITEIIQSLGGVTKYNYKPNNYYKDTTGKRIKGKPVHRLIILIDNHQDLFKLSRKKQKCTEKKKPIRRNIKSIEYVGEKECQCIKIADEEGLYLTDSYIVTHNTISHIIWQFEQVLKGQAGWNHWWVAPTIKQADIAYRRLHNYINHRSIFQFNDTHKRIIFPNGGILQCMSGEIPDNLYGEDVYSVVYDEFTRGREESFFALRSTVTATGGKIKFIGNVNGISNWGYKLARKAEAGRNNWEYFKITAADAVKAGILPQSEIDDAKDTLPEGIFLELYYGIPFVNSSNKFCFAFDEKKHVGKCEFNPEYPLYLSYDFNRNPICCSAIQDINNSINVLRTIKLENSNIYKLCQYIRNIYEYDGYKPLYIVCGDASGRARSAMVKDDVNYYIIIKAEMQLGEGQMQQIGNNPLIEDSQVLVNSILEHKTVQIDPEHAQGLIFDCKFVEMTADGKVKKGDRDDPTQQADALDNFKDYLWRFHRNFIKLRPADIIDQHETENDV